MGFKGRVEIALLHVGFGHFTAQRIEHGHKIGVFVGQAAAQGALTHAQLGGNGFAPRLAFAQAFDNFGAHPAAGDTKLAFGGLLGNAFGQLKNGGVGGGDAPAHAGCAHFDHTLLGTKLHFAAKRVQPGLRIGGFLTRVVQLEQLGALAGNDAVTGNQHGDKKIKTCGGNRAFAGHHAQNDQCAVGELLGMHVDHGQKRGYITHRHAQGLLGGGGRKGI